MATFQQVMELEQVPRRRQLIQSKVEEYSIRMAQLREILAKQRFEVAIGIDEQVSCPATALVSASSSRKHGQRLTSKGPH